MQKINILSLLDIKLIASVSSLTFDISQILHLKWFTEVIHSS